MSFIKNYLILTLMGLGFLFIVIAFILTARPMDPQEMAEMRVAQQAEQTAGQALANIDGSPNAMLPKTDILTIQKMDGGMEQFVVEFARTPEEWEKGLMERTELEENRGMLFIFHDEKERSFWMKNTFIPLDIIFIEKDGTIHHIHPNSTPKDLSKILSNGPVAYVLEIGGGVAEKLGIEVGDKVVHAEIHL